MMSAREYILRLSWVVNGPCKSPIRMKGIGLPSGLRVESNATLFSPITDPNLETSLRMFRPTRNALHLLQMISSGCVNRKGCMSMSSTHASDALGLLSAHVSNPGPVVVVSATGTVAGRV